MKKTYFLFLLAIIMFAWPFYYLYQRQLGAIPFLLIALFFFYVTGKQMKRFKKKNLPDINEQKQEKSNENSR